MHEIKPKFENGKKPKHENNSIDCFGCISSHRSTSCNNSLLCDDTSNCNLSINCHNSSWCQLCINCYNSTSCHNSRECNSSTGCKTCVECIYCSNLILEKFMVFNKQVTEKEFIVIKDKINENLGWSKHPIKLSLKDINWLKDNIKQFDQKVLDKIIKDSILPDFWDKKVMEEMVKWGD